MENKELKEILSNNQKTRDLLYAALGYIADIERAGRDIYTWMSEIIEPSDDDLIKLEPNSNIDVPTSDDYKLARIAVLESENDHLREECVKLAALLHLNDSVADYNGLEG